jgi:cathepsin A (carboxypeptidase C)
VGCELPPQSKELIVYRHHFLQLFTTDVFPKLKGKEFHITGESYAVSLVNLSQYDL